MEIKNDLLKADDLSLTEVIAQLERDLQMSGNAYEFVAKKPVELVKELEKLLVRIDNKSMLNSLVYRVDINMSKIDSEDFFLSLSQQIWNRCFQKVWFRKNWSAK